MHRGIGFAGETDGGERLDHPLADLLRRQVEVERAKSHVLGDGGADQLIVRVLEQQADLPPQLAEAGAVVAERLAGVADFAGLRAEQAEGV
jgi:hypothetical protein